MVGFSVAFADNVVVVAVCDSNCSSYPLCGRCDLCDRIANDRKFKPSQNVRLFFGDCDNFFGEKCDCG